MTKTQLESLVAKLVKEIGREHGWWTAIQTLDRLTAAVERERA